MIEYVVKILNFVGIAVVFIGPLYVLFQLRKYTPNEIYLNFLESMGFYKPNCFGWTHPDNGKKLVRFYLPNPPDGEIMFWGEKGFKETHLVYQVHKEVSGKLAYETITPKLSGFQSTVLDFCKLLRIKTSIKPPEPFKRPIYEWVGYTRPSITDKTVTTWDLFESAEADWPRAERVLANKMPTLEKLASGALITMAVIGVIAIIFIIGELARPAAVVAGG